jgi:class 3 adenylate cyclase
MDQPAHVPGGRTVISTVVFLDIVDYSPRAVSKQVMLKIHLTEVVSRAIEHVADTDRIVLDTGDGVALCFLGDPEEALFAANGIRDAVLTDPGPGGGMQLRIGINLGPVRIVKDINGNRNIIGDGINVAQRVMSFAEPNQILVSRSYFEVVSRLSEEYARLFQYVGLHRDKHIREHEVYQVNLARSSEATPAESGAEPARAAPDPPAPAAPRSPAAPEPAAFASPRFAPAVLARVTAALAEHLGPVARLVVQKDAARARDLHELCGWLAEGLPEASRAAFRGGLADLLDARPGAQAVRATSSAGPEPGAAAEGARTWQPEALARAEECLALHVGPIARVLVRRAAQEARGLHDLHERLAQHVPDARARERFLATLEERR